MIDLMGCESYVAPIYDFRKDQIIKKLIHFLWLISSDVSRSTYIRFQDRSNYWKTNSFLVVDFIGSESQHLYEFRKYQNIKKLIHFLCLISSDVSRSTYIRFQERSNY